MPARLRMSTFPPGPPDHARMNPMAPLCRQSLIDTSEWQTDRVQLDGPDSAHIRIRLPRSFQREPNPVLPSVGGVIWGEPPFWSWADRPVGTGSRVDPRAAVTFWSDRMEAYPSVGAESGTLASLAHECRCHVDSGHGWMNSFQLDYPTGYMRYFIVGAAPSQDGRWLKMIYHSSAINTFAEAYAMFATVEYCRL